MPEPRATRRRFMPQRPMTHVNRSAYELRSGAEYWSIVRREQARSGTAVCGRVMTAVVVSLGLLIQPSCQTWLVARCSACGHLSMFATPSNGSDADLNEASRDSESQLNPGRGTALPIWLRRVEARAFGTRPIQEL